MKEKCRQIVAFLCVIALLITQNSFSVFSANETETETEIEVETNIITLEENFVTTANLSVSKVYDGTSTAQLKFTDFDLPNVQGDDEVFLTALAEFTGENSQNVGEHNVTLKSFALTGEDADNYILDLPNDDYFVDLKGNIEPRTITLGEFSADLLISKVYDGESESTITLSNSDVDLTGVVEGDIVKLTAIASFENKNAGINKNVTLKKFVLTGEDADNYTLDLPNDDYFVDLIGNIEQKTIYFKPNESVINKVSYTVEIPKDLGLVKDIEHTFEGIVGNDKVTINNDDTTKLYIVKEGDIYKYVLGKDIVNGNVADENTTISISNTDYKAVLSDDITPTVSEPDAPVIKQAVVTIDTTNENNRLEYYDDLGIVANNSVTVSVTATAKQNLPVTFKLFDSEEKVEKVESGTENGTEYEFTADFKIEISDTKKNKVIENLICEVNNGTKNETTLKFQLEGNSNNKTPKLVLDKEKPTISPNYGSAVQKNGNYYYNKQGGNFSIVVTESNCLKSFNVTKEYQSSETETEVDISELTYDEDNGTYTYTVDTADLETGWYTYSAVAVDYAGNSSQEEDKADNEFKFYVDRTTPTGYIEVVSPDKTVVDSKNWIKENDDGKVTFRLYPETTGSAFEKFVFTVNNKEFEFAPTDLKSETDENGVEKRYVELEVDKRYVPYYNNTYNIVAKVTTIAGNDSEDIEYELHIDTEIPEVSDFTFEKKNNALETVLNVLTFGVFCNDSVELAVTVKDGPNDVGIKKVTIEYEGIEKAIDMYFDEDTSKYTCTLELLQEKSVFKNIKVTAYDELEKKGYGQPNTSNVESGDNVPDEYFVMLETVPPTVDVELPTSDDVERNDGQIWYNNKDNKYITLTVQDVDSGIRSVNFTVNDVPITEGEVNKGETTTLPTAGSTEGQITDELTYYFSIEDIASVIEEKDDGSYHIKCEVVDNAGNVAEIKEEVVDNAGNVTKTNEKVYYRDVTSPTIKKFDFVPPETVDGKTTEATELFTEPEQLEYGYYFKEKTNLVVTVDDDAPSSGLKKVKFKLVPSDNESENEKVESDAPEQEVKVENATEQVVKVEEGIATCTIIPVDFKGQVYAQVFDNVGNSSDEKTTYGLVVENESPTIKIQPLPDNKSKTDDEGNKLYTGSVSFRVTISDTKSGLKKISYSKNSDLNKKEIEEEVNVTKHQKGDVVGGWTIVRTDDNLVTEISQEFTFDKDDKNIFMTFNATDNCENNSKTEKSEKFTIDTASPDIEKFNFEPATTDDISEVETFIKELEYGFYFKKEFNAVVSVDDATPSSGLNKVIFRLVSYDNGEVVSETRHSVSVKDKKATYTIPAGFKGQIYAQVYDRAVNKSDEETPQAFVVDEVVPVITIEPLPNNNSKQDMDGNKLYTETVQFKVTISDEKSGLREIVYSKSSEKDSFDNVVTTINNISGYKENDVIDNGWQITKTDENLITEVSQVFTFTTDDNNIFMNFNATDRSKNTSDTIQSESFTIDTIAPKVEISNSSKPVNEKYYKDSTTYNITVTERNFDPNRMISKITNTFTSAQPTVSFATSASDSNVHIATVTFPEGDYDFSFSGEDCGGHTAEIYVDGNNEKTSYFHTSFNVDATAPQVSTNFEEFGDTDDTQIYFNSSKTARIEVIEHNFDEYDMNIKVESKFSGTAHSVNSEDWYEIGYKSDWKNNGDKHTLEITFDKDAVYRISIAPVDLAGNKSQSDSSAIYEIDTTVPELYSRNGKLASEKDFISTPYSEVYDEKKKDSSAPSVEFEDLNFDRIEVEAIVYIPEYKEGSKEIGEIAVDNSVSKKLSVPVKSNRFSLSDFDKDGVYSITYVAVDKAGNKSEAINDTYFRMVNTDVLAYICNSDIEEHTGYYSLMDENGKAISKKATDFKDLDISVIKLKDDGESGVLTLREDDEEYSPEEYITLNKDNVSETAIINKIHLPASYFSETFRDDSLDTRMYLSVSIRDNVYMDLASIHIDNEPPEATLPDDFVSWHNYMFTKETTVVFTNISETLNADVCKVYECPRNGERTEIPFEYDKENKTLSFVLEEGLHNIDVTLVDEAGNEWNVDRVKYLRVGNFRLYLGIGIGVVLIGIVVVILLWRKKKYNK